MLRRQKHALSQSTTPFACTLIAEAPWLKKVWAITHTRLFQRRRDGNKIKVCAFEGGGALGAERENRRPGEHTMAMNGGSAKFFLVSTVAAVKIAVRRNIPRRRE